MRLFVAVWPERGATDHLDAALDPLRTRFDALRWQPRDRWHLTMVFLGDVDDSRTPAAQQVVEDVAAARARVDDVSLRGSGTFGSVLWVGLAPDPSPLADAARDLSRRMRAAGFSVERRPWRPHVSVARARSADAPLHEAREALAPYAGPDWAARELTLVRSTTGPRPAYEVLSRAELSA